MSNSKVLLLSLIPVRKSGSLFETDSRWAKDVNMQAEFQSVILLCPIQELPSRDLARLSGKIEVVALQQADLEGLIERSDLVQLPGNFGWRRSQSVRRLLRLAAKRGKPVFIGISSNRAKTAWINRKGGLLGQLKGLVRWIDVRSSQRFLASKASGVFVVGSGIRRLARPNPNVHIGTASWVNESDIVERKRRSTVPRICCASRLEPMKGVTLGVDAMALLAKRSSEFSFDIVGEGPQLTALQTAVRRLGLQALTRFLGKLAYPIEFLSYLQTVDFVLLTNLNDEQPRLIFDAISQGCLPVCPNSEPYVALGLDERLLYQRGISASATATLERLMLISDSEFNEIEGSLRTLARECTLEAMHRLRAEWMESSGMKTG